MSHCKIWSIAITITSLLTSFAFAQDIAIRVQDWVFVKLEKEGKDFCYAMTIPYRTSLYPSSAERHAFMQFTWRGDNQYTLSINSGFILKDKAPVKIETVNNYSHQLAVASSDTSVTYSSTQDSYIINNLIQIDDYIKVRSIDELDNQAMDYYSMRGFVATLKLMENNCQ